MNDNYNDTKLCWTDADLADAVNNAEQYTAAKIINALQEWHDQCANGSQVKSVLSTVIPHIKRITNTPE